MGGRGSSLNTGSPTSSSSFSVQDRLEQSQDYVGAREVEYQINDILNHSLGDGETSVYVDSFRIISNPGDGEFGDVEAEYHVNVRIPIGYDPETGREEYETDTEYRSETFQVRLRNRRR